MVNQAYLAWLKGLLVAAVMAALGFLAQFLADPEACASWTWSQWKAKLVVAAFIGLGAGVTYMLRSPLPPSTPPTAPQP